MNKEKFIKSPYLKILLANMVFFLIKLKISYKKFSLSGYIIHYPYKMNKSHIINKL